MVSTVALTSELACQVSNWGTSVNPYGEERAMSEDLVEVLHTLVIAVSSGEGALRCIDNHTRTLVC
jgi:hypothetical protein